MIRASASFAALLLAVTRVPSSAWSPLKTISSARRWEHGTRRSEGERRDNGPLFASIEDTDLSDTQDDIILKREISLDPQQVLSSDCVCKFCQASFVSRNKLFQHLQRDPKCSILGGLTTGHMKWKRQLVQIQLSYITDDTSSPGGADAATAGETVAQALTKLTYDEIDGLFQGQDISNEVSLIKTTQSSVAKMRMPPRLFSQERGCAAAKDTMTVSLNVPRIMDTNTWRSIFDKLEASLPVWIRIGSCHLRSDNFHAERSCTQRTYHYILPVSWFPKEDAEAILHWYETGERVAVDWNPRKFQRVEKAPSGMQRFKTLLRRAENVSFENDRTRRSPSDNLASGRYGSFAYRQLRPWHNFVDPTLRGDASPSNRPVWHVVDRSRIMDFQEIGGELVLILELKGDEFFREQVRRIVGSAVAMMHGWLPEDFFEQTTRADRIVETVLAPPNRMYIAETRFHFDDMCIPNGDVTWTSEDKSNRWEWVMTHLFNQISNNEQILASEKMWLEDVELTVAPRIRGQLAIYNEQPQTDADTFADTTASDEDVPVIYHDVLKGLRDIVETNSWPDTSAARSTVIQNVSPNCGSFTLVNPDHGQQHVGSKANDMFPELTRAIFDLERELSRGPMQQVSVNDTTTVTTTIANTNRPPSSHCAVNCRAQFTPHVDSGTGTGQSLSMIVGLGNYMQGELFVEGDAIDIRYRPTEFDGWKLRHWTNRFVGERFSLVYFTPELKGSNYQA